MRLIVVLLALLIVGFLVYKQVGPRSDKQVQEAQAVSGPNVPKVPTNPNELDQLGTQMNDYLKEEAAKRAAAIEAAESQ